ncbi:MAG: hypothetical protein JWQ32_751 [Marmoricola sp.]|nr:hypothetical protein [Marmoricola sp.]
MRGPRSGYNALMTDEPRLDANADEREASDRDTESDPALDVEPGSDWTSEGGAAPEGPATDVDSDEESRP